MSVFPNWQEYAVPQRHEKSGCIPTGFELILRAAEVQGIDFSTFQEEFDLEYQGNGQNSFGSVAAAIQKKYPFVKLREKSFVTGKEKLEFIDEALSKKRPVIVSVFMGQGNGWHIMPVVDSDSERLVLLNQMRPDGTPELLRFRRTDLVTVHDTCSGGKELAFLEGEERQ